MRKMVGLIGIIASGLLLSLEIYMLKALPHHSTRADWRKLDAKTCVGNCAVMP